MDINTQNPVMFHMFNFVDQIGSRQGIRWWISNRLSELVNPGISSTVFTNLNNYTPQ